MGRKQKGKIVMCWFLTIIVFLAFAEVSVAAESTCTVILCCTDNDIILENMHWQFYRVGFRDGDELVLDGAFSDYPVSFGNYTVDDMSTAAFTLKTYASVDHIPCIRDSVTNKNGMLCIDNLDDGLYLAFGDSVVVNDMIYSPTPLLIELSKDKQNFVTAYPKLTVRQKNNDKKIYHYEVLLHWDNDDDDNWDRTKPIIIDIYRDREIVDKIILTENDNWTASWDTIYSDSEWLVIEKDSMNNYTFSYSSNTNQFLIINTFRIRRNTDEVTKPPVSQVITDQKLPQTGQLWWPVPILILSGLIFLFVGLRLDRKEDDM